MVRMDFPPSWPAPHPIATRHPSRGVVPPRRRRHITSTFAKTSATAMTSRQAPSPSEPTPQYAKKLLRKHHREHLGAIPGRRLTPSSQCFHLNSKQARGGGNSVWISSTSSGNREDEMKDARDSFRRLALGNRRPTVKPPLEFTAISTIMATVRRPGGRPVHRLRGFVGLLRRGRRARVDREGDVVPRRSLSPSPARASKRRDRPA